MTGFVSMRVTCFITPKDLREIAEEMERRWADLAPGQLTDTREWYVDEHTSINFSIDQDRMRKQAGPPWQNRFPAKEQPP